MGKRPGPEAKGRTACVPPRFPIASGNRVMTYYLLCFRHVCWLLVAKAKLLIAIAICQLLESDFPITVEMERLRVPRCCSLLRNSRLAVGTGRISMELTTLYWHYFERRKPSWMLCSIADRRDVLEWTLQNGRFDEPVTEYT